MRAVLAAMIARPVVRLHWYVPGWLGARMIAALYWLRYPDPGQREFYWRMMIGECERIVAAHESRQRAEVA